MSIRVCSDCSTFTLGAHWMTQGRFVKGARRVRKSEVRRVLRGKLNVLTIGYVGYGCSHRFDMYYWETGAISVGCNFFSAKTVAVIRRWAEGKLKTKGRWQ